MTLAYSVTREFYGTNAISGRVRRFKLGEISQEAAMSGMLGQDFASNL